MDNRFWATFLIWFGIFAGSLTMISYFAAFGSSPEWLRNVTGAWDSVISETWTFLGGPPGASMNRKVVYIFSLAVFLLPLLAGMEFRLAEEYLYIKDFVATALYQTALTLFTVILYTSWTLQDFSRGEYSSAMIDVTLPITPAIWMVNDYLIIGGIIFAGGVPTGMLPTKLSCLLWLIIWLENEQVPKQLRLPMAMQDSTSQWSP